MSAPNREQIVNSIKDMLMTHRFTFEYQVKEKPQGMKVICEVTQEQMDKMLENAKKKGGAE